MEEDIQHIAHRSNLNLAHLCALIEHVRADIRNSPPYERFEVPRNWTTHICLSSCLASMERIAWAVRSLHLAAEHGNAQHIQWYLSSAPSLALFTNEHGNAFANLLLKKRRKSKIATAKCLKYRQ